MKKRILIILASVLGLMIIGLLISFFTNGDEHIIVNSVKIIKPQSEVFEFVADMRNELKWNPDVQFVDKLSEREVSSGTIFKAKWHLSDTLEVTIQKFITPSEITFVNGGAIEVKLNLNIKSLNDSVTEIQSEFIAKPHGFVRAIFPIIESKLEKQEKLNMVNIKNYLENN